jgi:hypothetical protein
MYDSIIFTYKLLMIKINLASRTAIKMYTFIDVHKLIQQYMDHAMLH